MELSGKIKSFVSQCVRVWHLLRKPSKEEFKGISKISAIGLGLIGLLGFAISIAMAFIYPK
jgi:protein transport protein SEC61 subunit gamma-like protein